MSRSRAKSSREIWPNPVVSLLYGTVQTRANVHFPKSRPSLSRGFMIPRDIVPLFLTQRDCLFLAQQPDVLNSNMGRRGFESCHFFFQIVRYFLLRSIYQFPIIEKVRVVRIKSDILA